MKIGQRGLDLIKEFEGLSLTAYLDGGGVWTIGYGHTGNVVRGDAITAEQADAWLRNDVGTAERAVTAAVRVPLTQDQFDALASFTFNLGGGALRSSTLLKRLNAGDYAGTAEEFLRWKFDNGKEVAGLLRRRRAERALFLGLGSP